VNQVVDGSWCAWWQVAYHLLERALLIIILHYCKVNQVVGGVPGEPSSRWHTAYENACAGPSLLLDCECATAARSMCGLVSLWWLI